MFRNWEGITRVTFAAVIAAALAFGAAEARAGTETTREQYECTDDESCWDPAAGCNGLGGICPRPGFECICNTGITKR